MMTTASYYFNNSLKLLFQIQNQGLNKIYYLNHKKQVLKVLLHYTNFIKLELLIVFENNNFSCLSYYCKVIS